MPNVQTSNAYVQTDNYFGYANNPVGSITGSPYPIQVINGRCAANQTIPFGILVKIATRGGALGEHNGTSLTTFTNLVAADTNTTRLFITLRATDIPARLSENRSENNEYQYNAGDLMAVVPLENLKGTITVQGDSTAAVANATTVLRFRVAQTSGAGIVGSFTPSAAAANQVIAFATSVPNFFIENTTPATGGALTLTFV